MCGVFGFSQAGELAHKLAPMIAFSMEERGHDSWGGTNGVETIKRVGPILDSFEFPASWEQAIFHTRAATVGKVSERNAHPFICNGTNHKIIGIHNGHISNYEFLKTKHNRPWAEVDSEHFFQHLAERKPLDDLVGSGTLVWFEDEQPTIHLTRWNYGALEVASLPDSSICFASTRQAIEKACRFARVVPSFWQPLNDCFEHQIEYSEEKQRDILRIAKEKLSLGEARQSYTTTHTGGSRSGNYYNGYGHIMNGSSTHYQHDRSKFEKRCRRCTADDIDSFICKSCVAKLRAEFNKEVTV